MNAPPVRRDFRAGIEPESEWFPRSRLDTSAGM
jgi:hypothetical protein